MRSAVARSDSDFFLSDAIFSFCSACIFRKCANAVFLSAFSLFLWPLASLVLTVNHGACRNVNYSYCRFGLVDVLAARAARTVGLDDEVVLVYFNVIFNLRAKPQPSPLRSVFCPAISVSGNTLNTVNAAFELQTAERAVALDRKFYFPLCRRVRSFVDGKALPF